MNFTTLPNLIALLVLVAVFWSILRRDTNARIYLWLLGWMLVLLHFTAALWSVENKPWSLAAFAVNYDALALAAVAFLVSVSRIATGARRRLLLACTVGIPCVAYLNGVLWDVNRPLYYYAVCAIGLVATLSLFLYAYRKADLYAAGICAGTVLAVAVVVLTITRGRPEMGITFILASLNFAVAALYWNHYRRTTAGVLTTVSGFALWGAVFPIGLALAVYAPAAKVDSEVWNIPKYLVAVGMILTLLEEQIEKSRYLAYHDELTGLPNRRLLDDRMDHALAHANRTRSKVAVLLLDLDRFKEVNDSFGHRVGDLALQEVVARLGTRIRASDTLARSGGDEFTVVSYVPDLEGAKGLVSALEDALALPLRIQDKEVQTGLSVGLALYPDDGSNPDQLHAAADRAMYVVKRATRGAKLAGSRPPAGPGLAGWSASDQLVN